jgi:hypothetical protein
MNLKKLKNLIANNQEGGSKPPFYFIHYIEVIVMNSKRLEILRHLPSDFLLFMIDNVNDLDKEMQQVALEEIIYVLYEREVKANEQETW